MIRSPLQPMWDLTIHPLTSPTSSLTHRSVHGFDTICNSPSPPLADIVFSRLFLSDFPFVFSRLSLLGFPSRFQNASVKDRFPHPYKECFVPLEDLVLSLVPGSDTICNNSIPPLADIVFSRLSLSGFPSRF